MAPETTCMQARHEAIPRGSERVQRQEDRPDTRVSRGAWVSRAPTQTLVQGIQLKACTGMEHSLPESGEATWLSCGRGLLPWPGSLSSTWVQLSSESLLSGLISMIRPGLVTRQDNLGL